jgi:integrase
MKFTKSSVAALQLPAGKDDHIAFDASMRGFGVRLRAGGKRTWIAQIRAQGRTRRLAIGDVSQIDLEVARTAARKFFAEATLGQDPVKARAEARLKAANTFGKVADLYLAAREPDLRAGSIRHIRRYLERYFAKLHGRPIDSITRADVALAIKGVAELHGKVTGARARATLSAFFAWAMKEGIAEANPVLATNSPAVEKPRSRTLSPPEIKAIWSALPDNEFGQVVRLLFWTGCRRGEIGELRWDEVDLDRARLVIPGERTKTRHELRLPLVEPALELLRSIPRRSQYVFGSVGFVTWSAPIDELRKALALAGDVTADWRLHDIRRTLKTELSELGVDPWVSERILGHVKGGVEAVYDWSKLERPMRQALQLWADRLRSIVDDTESTVVALRA